MQLRFLTDADSDDLFLWRNDPVTRAMSRNHEVVTPEQHRRWFSKSLADPVRILFMGMLGPRKIGLVRFDRVGDGWEVGINLNPAERGQGLGATLLRLGTEHFWAINPGQRLTAEVRLDNAASRKIFEACGFRRIDTDAEHDHFEAQQI